MKLRIQPLAYTEDASRLFDAFAAESWAVFLDSAGLDRFDIIAARPSLTLVTQGRTTLVSSPAGSHESEESPFDLLRASLAQAATEPSEGPLPGSLMGYLGYDLGRQLQRLPDREGADAFPDLAFGRYDWLIVVDHRTRRAELRADAEVLNDAQWQGLIQQLQAPPTQPREPQPNGHGADSTTPEYETSFDRFGTRGSGLGTRKLPRMFHSKGQPLHALSPIQANPDWPGYAQAFARVQAYIRDGDCYQINLARRFQAQVGGDAWLAYQQLRQRSPAPFGGYFNLPWGQLLSNSPEAFLRLRAGRVCTSPIKGTRPRSKDAMQDSAALAELQASAKDRAENLMIVDLLRNDLGRSCAYGSIRVDRLFRPASFANVHHLISDISGQLRPGEDALSLLANCFPGGSITGAPKRRAMQIIDQLEPARRGPYCGSLTWIGPDGSMDSNILIRSLMRQGDQAWFWAGGGLVADSVAEEEFAETEQKASVLRELLQGQSAHKG
jgi:para-aminobenzoate synthetase component 1